MRKYYEILGLKPGATKEQVRKAYRRMAMQYHPDVNPSPDARRKFTEVLEAYEYLTGIRNARGRHFSQRETQDFYDLMRKRAEERAKARYRERVRQFRKKREEQQNREYQKAILLLMGIALLAVAVWQGYGFYSNLVINRDPVVAEAEVVGLARNRMIYSFPVADSLYKDRQYVSNYQITMLTETGLPLRSGDKFRITYSQDNPSFHKIDFSRVSPATMQRYLELVSKRLQYIYLDEWQHLDKSEQNIRSLCMSMLVFEKFGYDGLSRILFFDVNFLDNLSHNNLTWYFMRKSDEYQEIKRSCEMDSIFRNL